LQAFSAGCWSCKAIKWKCACFQDGVEEYNWIEHNFAGFVHPIGVPAGGYDQTGTLHVQVCAVDRPQAGISKCTGRLPGLGPPQAPESSILAVLAQAAGFSILQLHG